MKVHEQAQNRSRTPGTLRSKSRTVFISGQHVAEQDDLAIGRSGTEPGIVIGKGRS